jgi:hypothetical protein
MKIAGVILILSGILALAFERFTYTTHNRAVDSGAGLQARRISFRARTLPLFVPHSDF